MGCDSSLMLVTSLQSSVLLCLNDKCTSVTPAAAFINKQFTTFSIRGIYRLYIFTHILLSGRKC